MYNWDKTLSWPKVIFVNKEKYHGPGHSPFHNQVYWFLNRAVKAFFQDFTDNMDQKHGERVFFDSQKDYDRGFSRRRDEYLDRPPRVTMWDLLDDLEKVILSEIQGLVIRTEREWAFVRISGYLEMLYHLAGRKGKYVLEWDVKARLSRYEQSVGRPPLPRPEDIVLSLIHISEPTRP